MTLNLSQGPLLDADWHGVSRVALLVCISIVIWAGYKFIFYPNFLSAFRHVPRAKGGYPLIGNAMVGFERPPGESVWKVTKKSPNDGMLNLRGVVGLDQILLTKHELISEMLVDRAYEYEKPDGILDAMETVVGNSLLVAKGDVHRQHRRQLMPGFNIRPIRSLYPIFWKKGQAFNRAIISELGIDRPSKSGNVLSGSFDFNHRATILTMDNLICGGVGVDLDLVSHPDHPIVAGYEEALEPTPSKVFMYLATDMGIRKFADYLCWGTSKSFEDSCARLRSIVRDIVREKVEQQEKGTNSEGIFTQVISSQGCSQEKLVEHTLTLIAAGHETISAGFAWVIHSLARNPDIQTRLRQEINANIPKDLATDPDARLAEILESLPLLNAVCYETIRLYPSVYVVYRTAVCDTFIGGLPVPKGTRLMSCPWSYNRNPEIWGPRSEEWIPSRWLDPKTGKFDRMGGVSPKAANMSFHFGPRNCIGQEFARTEMRSLVAAFVTGFEFELSNPDEVLQPTGLVSARPGYKMMINVRTVEAV
ncbi:hypothetical protein ASPWEDRAFT_33357 [Aspergillus wentii DTO 134E9]|uniref:Cytochrome P450 n=1 Tax=Aspergillus wentii DTO 134E9 TaxID=1073089 RepID=A0A1L9RYM5_ASPWE|nr:uncharacterized protein ASPWEDRAFT_33357 [Aspergillus wentii DTO 134E9]KAI9932445.1 hypothetical protein MW887_008686 [Aspergillus wentii]OJJ40012.1 hypothetical protein ASPWEDRAFT_33357 [Aspergillus wentii DTO 134E9]